MLLQKNTLKVGVGGALLLDGSKKMLANIYMNNNKIINLTTDTQNILSATNVGYVNKKINESHITGSDSKIDVFRYIMNDVNEALSEDNIIVDGINDFSSSPHDINKKAYFSEWEKVQKMSIHPDLDLMILCFQTVRTLW